MEVFRRPSRESVWGERETAQKARQRWDGLDVGGYRCTCDAVRLANVHTDGVRKQPGAAGTEVQADPDTLLSFFLVYQLEIETATSNGEATALANGIWAFNRTHTRHEAEGLLLTLGT